MTEERCPHIKRYPNADIDLCTLFKYKVCGLELGEICDEWEDIQEEWKRDEIAWTDPRGIDLSPLMKEDKNARGNSQTRW